MIREREARLTALAMVRAWIDHTGDARMLYETTSAEDQPLVIGYLLALASITVTNTAAAEEMSPGQVLDVAVAREVARG